jgi:hypothetical protein
MLPVRRDGYTRGNRRVLTTGSAEVFVGTSPISFLTTIRIDNPERLSRSC